MKSIDLRSDTVTKPSSAMLEAMIKADVGDDVYGEDATVNKLQNYLADMFGFDKALFCPTGTMSNQIGLKLHCEAMSEVILEEKSHVYNFEVGGIANLSSSSVRLIRGENGKLQAEQIADAIRPVNDVHMVQSAVVSLENTTNMGGGAYYCEQELQDIRQECNRHNLKLHLDGARLFNALQASDLQASEIGRLFDTVSVCLSKGLGAPVGSLLLCKEENYFQAKRIRKALGGGMRQAGYMAAAGLYALENNIERIQLDHQNAVELSVIIKKLPYVEYVAPVYTNIILFRLKSGFSHKKFLAYLNEKNIKANSMGDSIRFVTHLDISREDIFLAEEVLKAWEEK